MDNILRQFNGDIGTKEAFKEFLITVIEDEIIKRVFEGMDVSHAKDAKELIDRAFDELDIKYGLRQETKKETNQAR